MDKQEIPFLSATELAGLIKSREVSPVEATEAYLDRIGEEDGKLNSYITVTGEEALGGGTASRSGDCRGQLPGALARHSGGGEGPA